MRSSTEWPLRGNSGEWADDGGIFADRALCLSWRQSLRADTDFPNERMQHVLEKNGFEKGVVVFQGSGKLAYDKTLA